MLQDLLINPNSTLIVAHDAGGAEILSSLAVQIGGQYFSVSGPARNIFHRKIENLNNLTLDEGLMVADTLICGTGWQSDFEYQAIKTFKAAKKKVIAFLDHWVNYRERFIRHGVEVLPNEIWVGDHYAENIASQHFQKIIPIKYVPNPYFQEIREQLKTLSTESEAGSKTILYLCEPISVHAEHRCGNPKYWGYTEFEAIEYFLKQINKLKGDYDQLIIRPHPTEEIEKYSWVKVAFDGKISISNDESLLSQIANSSIVVGCQTMAMVIGILANKRVISCIPPGGSKCQLPYLEIEILK